MHGEAFGPMRRFWVRRDHRCIIVYTDIYDKHKEVEHANTISEDDLS